MKIFQTILLILGFCFSSDAQWRSYYPEGTSSNKNQQKIDNEKLRKDFKNCFFSAVKARSLENYDEALQQFQRCIKIDDKNPLPFYESATINAEKGNYEVALEQIKEAVNLDPKNRWYCLLNAKIAFNQQDFLNAAMQYRRLITLEPGNEELYYMLAETHIYSNNFKKAIKVYEELELHKGVDKTLSMQKHQLYRQINDIKGAIKELKKISDRFPEDIELMEILSELHLLNDEKEKAFELFKKIAIINPNNGRIHLTLADYYRENGDNEKSYKELKLAFKSTELDIDTKIRILISYYQLILINEELKVQAYQLAEILLLTHPEELKARAVYADILYTDNQYQKAKEQYILILQKDKKKSEVWSQVLFIQAEQNDFEGMWKTSEEALEYFAADPLFYYFNGISKKWFKNYEEAINSLEIGVEFVVENNNLLVEFYSSLGDCYHMQKIHKTSDNYYEKALEIDSNNTTVLNNYAYYLSLRRVDLERAKQMSYRSNELELESATFQDTYAWILYQLKEYNIAKEWLLKALLNGGDENPVVVEHYGDVLYKLGEFSESLNQWKKAKKIGGDSNLLIKKIKDGILYE